jgi:hypothetical protein
MKRDDTNRALMLGDFVGIYEQSGGRSCGARGAREPLSSSAAFPVGRRHAVRMADRRRVPLTTALTHKAIDVPAASVCVPALKYKLHAVVDIVAPAGTLMRRGPPMV